MVVRLPDEPWRPNLCVATNRREVPIADIEPKGCLVDYLSIANRQAEIKTRPNGTQSGIFR